MTVLLSQTKERRNTSQKTSFIHVPIFWSLLYSLQLSSSWPKRIVPMPALEAQTQGTPWQTKPETRKPEPHKGSKVPDYGVLRVSISSIVLLVLGRYLTVGYLQTQLRGFRSSARNRVPKHGYGLGLQSLQIRPRRPEKAHRSYICEAHAQ